MNETRLLNLTKTHNSISENEMSVLTGERFAKSSTWWVQWQLWQEAIGMGDVVGEQLLELRPEVEPHFDRPRIQDAAMLGVWKCSKRG